MILIGLAVLARFGSHLSLDAAIVEHDWYTMHLVDALHVERAFDEGQLLPGWSPWVLGGSPLWGVSTKPFSYPPFLLAVWSLGATAAMNALLLLHALLGGIGCLLLGKRLGLEGPGPLLCGLLFVLARFPANGFQATPFGFGYAIAWWPYFLIALIDLLQDRGFRWAGLRLGIFGALQWHAGGQPSLYWLLCFSVLFALPYVIEKGKGQGRWLGLPLALVVFLGLIAVKLLPELAWLESSGREAPLSMELARDSALEEELLRNGGTSRLLNLARILVAQYGGAVGLILTLGTLLACLRSLKRRTFWACTLGTLFVFALASGALHEWAHDGLPGYDRMRRHSRFVHMVGFGWILMAAHGFPARIGKCGPLATTALLTALAFVETANLPGLTRHDSALRSAREQQQLFAAMAAPILEDPALGRVQLAHRAQTDWVAQGLEGSGGALGGPNSGNRLYHEFLGEHGGTQALQRNSRGALDVMNVRYLLSDSPLGGEGLDVVLRPGALEPQVFNRLKELGVAPLFVARRLTARPRLCAVRAATLVVGPERERREVIHQVIESPGYRPMDQVFVESPGEHPGDLTREWTRDFPRILFVGRSPEDPALVQWAASAGEGVLRKDRRGAIWLAATQETQELRPVEDRRHHRTMDTLQLDVEGLGERMLVLSECTTLDAGWSATVDGVPLPLLRADGLVTLLRIPADARRIRMEYTPPGRSLGAWISALSVLLVFVGALRWRRTERTGAREVGEEATCTG